MAAFTSALGILSALCATQPGVHVANVLIANAARGGGAEGRAVAAALADWVAYLQAGKFLTLADETRRRCAERLLQSLAALPDTTPFAAVNTAIACTADVRPEIGAALVHTTNGGTFWTALVKAVATVAGPEDLQAIQAAVKDQGGMSLLPAWARAATHHVLGAMARPCGPHRLPSPRPPQPAPWAHQPHIPSATAPWQVAYAALAPPHKTRVGSPDVMSRMRAALPRPLKSPSAGAPPTYHDMEHGVKKGSPATSLDELPRPLVSALPGFGLRVVVCVLEAFASGTPS